MTATIVVLPVGYQRLRPPPDRPATILAHPAVPVIRLDTPEPKPVSPIGAGAPRRIDASSPLWTVSPHWPECAVYSSTDN